MIRIASAIPALFLAAVMTACSGSSNDSVPVKISAVELHKTFMSDAKAAEKRWTGKMLLITGEVAIAKARTSAWTMSGEVQVPAQVYLRTELDYLESDIKYVICDGDFDAPQTGGGFSLDPRITVGKPLTVECRPAKFSWSSPGLYLLNCRIEGL